MALVSAFVADAAAYGVAALRVLIRDAVRVAKDRVGRALDQIAFRTEAVDSLSRVIGIYQVRG